MSNAIREVPGLSAELHSTSHNKFIFLFLFSFLLQRVARLVSVS